MPPKAEITKDQILNASFEIVRKQGLEALTARSIAQNLKCSTQPIYSTYGSMDELKDDVYSRAIDFAIVSMKQYEDDSNSSAMKLVLGCLLFAKNEKKLFRTIFLSDYRRNYLTRYKDRLNEEIYTAFLQIDERLHIIPESKVQKMFHKLMAYWLGIGILINTDMLNLEINEATAMLEEMYRALSINEGLE